MTDVVHTFELSLGESYVDMRKWKANISMFPTVDLCRGVNGQPLYVMACRVADEKDADSHPCTAAAVFSFELWHKDLLGLGP
jgi:hypothetical protein